VLLMLLSGVQGPGKLVVPILAEALVCNARGPVFIMTASRHPHLGRLEGGFLGTAF